MKTEDLANGTSRVFEGAGLRPNWVNSVSGSARNMPGDIREFGESGTSVTTAFRL